MFDKQLIKKLKKSVRRDDEDRLPVIFNALSDRGRFRIFRILMKNQDVCVSDIAGILGVSVSAASQQFKILEMTGLARKERMGQRICYRVAHRDPLVRSIASFIKASLKVEIKTINRNINGKSEKS